MTRRIQIAVELEQIIRLLETKSRMLYGIADFRTEREHADMALPCIILSVRSSQ